MLSHVWTHPAILDSHHSNHPAVSQGCSNIGESKPQEGQCGHFTSFCVSTQFSPCIWPWFGDKSVSNAKNNIYIYIIYIYIYIIKYYNIYMYIDQQQGRKTWIPERFFFKRHQQQVWPAHGRGWKQALFRARCCPIWGMANQHDQ